MPLARRILLLLLSTLCALAARRAFGQPGLGTCGMGETRNATFGLQGQDGLGVTVYQWFDPGTCGFCLVSQGAIQLRTLEIDVFTTATGATDAIDATVSVVGWKGNPACP